MAIPTVFIVLTLIFIGVRVLPGDPAAVLIGEEADAKALEAFREAMGLNKSLWAQYVEFLGGLAKGDLGTSMLTGYPVKDQVKRILPYTLELTFAGMLIGILIGVPSGVVTALYRNRFLDYVGRVFSLVGQSFPSFFLALLLLLLFSLQLGWFPTLSSGGRGNVITVLWYLFLPALTLGIAKAAYITRMTRAAMLNVLSEDYIRTAHAKGLRTRTVHYIHGLKAALVPIISVIGVYSVVTLGGSVMVEMVFSRPGLGQMMVGAMLGRDYVTLQSVMVLFALFVIVINLLTDLLCGIADPRVRYD